MKNKGLIVVLSLLFVLSAAAAVIGTLEHMKKDDKPTKEIDKPEEKKEVLKYEYYLEDELQTVMPTNPTSEKVEGEESEENAEKLYSYSKYQCDNDITGNFDTETWVFTPDVKKEGTCKLYFVKNKYDLTLTFSNATLDSGENNTISVPRESDGQVIITPNEGYEYKSVVCSNDKSATYDISSNTLNVPSIMEDTACKIDFEIKQLKMDLTVKNGKGTTTETSEYGGSVSAVVQANDGFENPSVTCTNNQEHTLENNEFRIAKLTDNTKCTVTFNKTKPTTYKLKIEALPSVVKISMGNKEQNVEAGKDGKIALKTDDGFVHKIDCHGVMPSKEESDPNYGTIYTFLEMSKDISCNVTAEDAPQTENQTDDQTNNE